ncbi:proteasome regulatory particle base subunit, partial [Ceratobasidium sp. 423]
MPEVPLPVAPVTSDDPKKKDEEKAKKDDKGLDGKLNGDKKEGEGEELSEEDQQLRNELEMLAERLKEPDTSLYKPALETLRTLIKTSTSSMTSVPKPLKFLRPLYPELQELHEKWPASDNKNLFADILSVLAMTYSDTQPRGTLKYRLASTAASKTPSDPGSWGHEYIRHLAAELGAEYLLRTGTGGEPGQERLPGKEGEEGIEELRELGLTCAKFLLKHNAEADAVDLLLELECIDRIASLVDANTFARVCLYMVSCVNLLPPPDDLAFLRTAHEIYINHSKFPEALALAIRIGEPELIIKDFKAPGNPILQAGALLATGILHCGIRTETDAVIALLADYVENKSVPLRTCASIGIGIAYAGAYRQSLAELLLPLVADETLSMEVSSLAALAIGFIFVGSCNGEVAMTILQTLMEREESALNEKWTRFMILGLALLYLGRQDASDATIEALRAVSHPVAKQALVLVEICSFAGTSNVLKVQRMLHECNDHIEGDDSFQGFAVIGIALVAMGEDVGAEMSLRQFQHLMHYGSPTIRKAVPLALGLISASNPQLGILDTLSKYSHDNDLAVALNAIFAMGIVGAGTNNARLGQMLRQLAGYYHKEPDCLFMVRIAQGLVHMGKGTLGINPFFNDRSIMSKPAVAGLLATLIAFTDAKAFILDKSHWMLYFLVTAMYPRFMITLDDKLESLPVTVRVGQAVDVVGLAGKPRTISGFQTYQSPVRLGTTERAELGTEEYIPYAAVLEGFVILEKNPGYVDESKME